MNKTYVSLLIFCALMPLLLCSLSRDKNKISKPVSQETMKNIYNEVKTPYKYGVVLKHPDSKKLVDCPTIYRVKHNWYMTYIVFDGKGYETWLAESKDLVNWSTKGKLLPFTEGTWDANQKAGYMSLVNTDWGGNYRVEKFSGKYWMSYLGGSSSGYEAGVLGVGLASSETVSETINWTRGTRPILNPKDQDSRWFESKTIYKSLIIHDKEKHTGHPFVMYYNAKGDTANYESIGMAVSDDMVSWKRFGTNPVLTKHKGICGDAQITKINGVYVMFYFGAFWKSGAFDRFACSYDLINWSDWEGEDLVASSESYDKEYAHKPWVIKWKGVVYHFYTAVGKQGRVIALATSRDLRK